MRVDEVVDRALIFFARTIELQTHPHLGVAPAYVRVSVDVDPYSFL